MTPGLDLRPSTDRVAALLSGVDESRLDGPTPCPDYRVRELLGHVDGLAEAFRAAADKDLGPATDRSPTESLPELTDGWQARIPVRLGALAASWRAEPAWTGMTRAGGVDLPGEVAGIVALNEVTLHGWDLAVATGQPYEVDDATATALLGFVSQFTAETRSPIFGPPVPVAEDAPLFHRVLALSGRDPEWTP